MVSIVGYGNFWANCQKISISTPHRLTNRNRLTRPVSLNNRPIYFHPLFVFATALFLAMAFVFWTLAFLPRASLSHVLFYYTPIGIPFVAFLFDRAERRSKGDFTWLRFDIDLLVILIALARTIVHIPWISGHALFLTYALITGRSPILRVTAAIVFIQVAYLKIFVWHDISVLGGFALGCLAAIISQRTNIDAYSNSSIPAQ